MQNKPKQKKSQNPKLRGLRHYARSCALQALYQQQLSGTPISEIEAEFIQDQIRKDIDLDYFKELIKNVNTNQADIDKAITPYLSRALGEVDPIELAVLRIAIYELQHRPDIPYRIIINEALELTKEFGSVEGYKFVNGILDKAAKNLRQVEVNMKKDS